MKRLLYPLLAVTAACTVVIRPPAEQPPPQQAPPVQAPPPGPSYAVTLGVPPGQLPDPGECRIWYPGARPSRQPRPRSRPCEDIGDIAPAGSWIIYRPVYDRRLVYVRVVDDRRAGYVTRVWLYDYDTYQFVREEAPRDDWRRQPPPAQPPPAQPPPAQPPPAQPPPQEPPVETPPPLSPLARAAPLGVPNDQLPDLGQCRMWIPGAQLSQQPQPRTRSCQGIVAISPARNWVIYRPTDDSRLAYVGVVSERRAGALIRILAYDIGTTHLVREEAPQNPWPPVPPPPVQPPPAQPPPQQPPPQQPPPAQLPPTQPPPPFRPPPTQPPPTQPPPAQPPPAQPPPAQPPPAQPPPAQPPPEQPPPAQPPTGPATLNVPPGHLPDLGQCRVWIPGVPPGLQQRPKSRSCDGIAASARAGSWILYRPANDDKVVHVRVVDAHRAGDVVRVWVYDIQSKRLLREESP